MADVRRPLTPEMTAALERLGRLSLRELSMEELLQHISDLSSSVMPGRPEASVTLLVKDRARTVASSGELATRLDECQYAQDDGPCLNAARTGEVTEIVDARAETRWPDYAQHAADGGSLSSLSLPLLIDQGEQVTGALNVYARQPAAFDDVSRGAGLSFASYAEVAAGNLHAFRSARDIADNLRIALESRGVIDQAKGILMERHKLTADRAFQLLAQASMASNIKVRQVAEQLVSTGELPSAPPVLTARSRPSRPGGSAPGRWSSRAFSRGDGSARSRRSRTGTAGPPPRPSPCRLVRTSNDGYVELRDVAHEVVDTGELPR